MKLYSIYLKLIYGKLSHIKFLSHFNYFIPLPEVQSMSRPFDGFLTCVLRNKELVMIMLIKDYDIIIVISELMIPSWIPFPTIIYEPILIPFMLTWSLILLLVLLLFILTWSLHDTPPHQSQSCPQAEEVAFIFSHLPCSVLEYAPIMLEIKLYPRMYFSYSGCVT